MRKVYRKKRTRRYRKKTGGVRRLANKVQKYLGELKYGDSSAYYTVSYNGACYSLSDIAQGGATDTSRSGDQLTLQSLKFNYSLVLGDSFNLFRVIIFQWYPLDTVAPSPGDLLQAVGTVDSPLSTYEHDRRFQKHVLYDKLHNLHTYQPQIVKKVKITKFKKNRIQYAGGTTTGQNKIYVLVISDSSTVSHPSILWRTKILFKDS